MKIGIAVLIAAGAAFFLLKGGDPSCETACEKAISVVSQEEDWSKKKIKKESRKCVGMCTEGEWSGSMRTCIAGIKDEKDAEQCFEKEEKYRAERGGNEGSSKYARRAKTTEAIDMLDKIYKGAAYYYTAPHVNREGRKLGCQFPASTGVTPGKSCCGSLGSPFDKDKDGRCDVDPASWDNLTWASLSFQINDQHYFTYAFDWNGKTLSEARFTASAYGDLDCDGEFSTF